MTMITPKLDSLPSVAPPPAPSESDRLQAQRIATEFEALLLKQITSSLNTSSDDEDADMFRSDANDMYRNMFSEQLAQSIAKNGGIGIADVLVDKMLAKNTASARPESKNLNDPLKGLSQVNSAIRELRANIGSTSDLSATPTNNEQASVAIHAHPVTASLSAPPATGASAEILNATRPRRVAPAAIDNTYAHVTLKHVGEPVEIQPVESASPAEVELRMPLQGRISSNFGYRRHPILGMHKHHDGVDIAAPRGTPIGAAATGTVIFAGRQGGYGNTIVIQHPDGRTTRYAHAERLAVEKGEIVQAGQTIATVGSSGRSTGPHLHFEVVENDRRTDPLKAIINDSSHDRR